MSHQPTPGRGPRAPLPSPRFPAPRPSTPLLLAACLAAATALSAWQALVLPALVTLLRPALGAAAPFIAQALSLLAGAALLYALLRGMTSRADATASTHARQPWADCELQLLELAQALPVGLLVAQDDRIVHANPAAREQLGLDADALPSATPASLFAEREAADAALAGALPFEAVLPLRRSNGETFRARLTVRAITLDQRRFRVLVFDDLSESDRLDARLRQQRTELQALAGRLLTVQEDERRALSRELHDDIGQAITAIKLGAVSLLDPDGGAGGALAQADRGGDAEIVNEIIATADQTVVKLRNLSMLLRPPQLDALGLEAALRWQSQALFRTSQIGLELDLAPLPRRPDPAVELACFRIAQEALTNVLRHAGAHRVTVALAAQGETLVLSVEDDGRGFEPGRTHGLGLVTMRERAQQLGGSFRIDTDPGVGTRLHARLPMAPVRTTPA